jgi:hypothetical protein
VSVPPKLRLKNIKRTILEQLGLADVCQCRLYFHSGEKSSDPGQSKEAPPFQPGAELTGEMSTLQELGLQNGGRVEI